MGDVIYLNQYRDSQQIEQIYQRFVTHTNKFLGLPTDGAKASVIVYCILRYLEGTINGINLLESLDPKVDKNLIKELKELAVPWIKEIEKLF